MSDERPALLHRPDEVTPEWLSTVLGVPVAGFEATPVGTGQMGDSVRYSLEPAPPGGPASVVIKFAAANDQSRATGVGMRSYEIEIRFYQHLKPTVGIRTPGCFHADVDPATGWFTLVLEDMAPARQGDQIAGCSVDHAALALSEAAKLHAPRWGDEALAAFDWLDRSTSAGTTDDQLGALLGMLWPGFAERYSDRLSGEHLALGERTARNLPALNALRSDTPLTVVHGDYRLDNMLFGEPASAAPLAVVDWQTCTRGQAMGDIGYFLGAGLLTEDRRKVERDLVADYVDALRAGGVEGYTWDQAWEDYRVAGYTGLVMAILASMVVERTDRGDDMFMAMASRHATQLLDLEADRLLPL